MPDTMVEQQEVVDHLLGYDNVRSTTAHGYLFFFYGDDLMLPFATIATEDNEHDRVSDLTRRGVYRLNLGVAHDTYVSRFGTKPAKPGPSGVVETGHDFTCLDELMPHPHYAPQGWMCVVGPSREMFAEIQPLIREAYEIARRRELGRSGAGGEEHGM